MGSIQYFSLNVWNEVPFAKEIAIVTQLFAKDFTCRACSEMQNQCYYSYLKASVMMIQIVSVENLTKIKYAKALCSLFSQLKQKSEDTKSFTQASIYFKGKYFIVFK